MLDNVLNKRIDLKLPVVIIALLMFWWVLSPKNSSGMYQYTFYFVSIFSALVFILSIKYCHIPCDSTFSQLLILLLLSYIFLNIISLIINFNDDVLLSKSLIYLLKPTVLFVYFMAAYAASIRASEISINNFLLIFIVFLLIIQFVIGVSQLYMPDVLDLLYDSTKTRGFGQIIRITGTMSNPNWFAFAITVLMSAIIYLASIRLSIMCLIFCVLLIILSGSRTGFLFFSVAVSIAFTTRNSLSFRKFSKAVFGSVIFFGCILVVIFWFREQLPYASQIFNVFNDGANVNSLSSRFGTWSKQLGIVLNGDVIRFMFGYWHSHEFRVSDNDFLYVFIHYGFIGLLLHVSLYILLFTAAFKYKRYALSRYLFSFMIIVFIFGLTAETLVGWFVPLIAVTLLGVLVGLEKTNQKYFCYG